MRRRAARVVRRGLFVLGVVSLLCLPPSFFYAAWIGSVGSNFEWFVEIFDGAILAGRKPSQEDPGVFYGAVRITPIQRRDYYSLAFFPTYRDDFDWPGVKQLTIPLWLLAFICLAWPVTSFILARRRPKRGFPVEPKPPDAVVPPSTS